MRSWLREDSVLRFAFPFGFITGLLLNLQETKKPPFAASVSRTRAPPSLDERDLLQHAGLAFARAGVPDASRLPHHCDRR
jgi:hypothetical protein